MQSARKYLQVCCDVCCYLVFRGLAPKLPCAQATPAVNNLVQLQIALPQRRDPTSARKMQLLKKREDSIEIAKRLGLLDDEKLLHKIYVGKFGPVLL